MYRLITECLLGYEIRAAASIGRHFTIHHGYGVVANRDVATGDDFTLHHGTTIGNPGASDPSCPVIGNGAELGANATLLDGVVTDDNVTIGAGSAVVDSVPDSTLVIDEKARVKVVG